MDAVENSLVLIPAHALLQSSADLTFPYRQDSNFWYLTGIDEPDLLLAIDTTDASTTIMLPARSEYQNEWDGELDTSKLEQLSGIDAYVPIDKLESMLKAAVKSGKKIGYLQPLENRVEPYGFYSNPARRLLQTTVKEILSNIESSLKIELVDVRMQLARLRQVKQPAELASIQKAIEVTATTIQKVKASISVYASEKDIERALSSQFHKHADGHAFEPIVASGKNAATIHYKQNSAPIVKNQLLLLDIGALHNKYAADISRTWAVGTPTKRAVDLHAALLDVQDYAFSLLKPGVLLRDNQKKVETYSKKLFSKMGVKTSDYPHGISHFLGIDVHDAGDYGSPLAEGTVITVEPGIYLPEEGIGIRIEDNVRITKNGVENMSKMIPRSL